MTEPTLVKKITIKEICELGRSSTEQTKAYFLEAAKNNTELAVLIGEVTGFGVKETQYGPSHFLTGLFLARNSQNGAMMKAGKCYLSKDASETIIAQLNRVNDMVKFALSVSVVEDKGGATGYTYVYQPVRTPETINREAEMLAQFVSLPAPKAQAKLASKK